MKQLSWNVAVIWTLRLRMADFLHSNEEFRCAMDLKTKIHRHFLGHRFFKVPPQEQLWDFEFGSFIHVCKGS